MAGLLKRKKKKGRNTEREPVTYDYSFDDTMESITAGLPGLEDEEEEAPQPPEQPEDESDTPSDTPDEALAKFRAQHGYADPEDGEGASGDEEDEEAGGKKRRHFFRGKGSRLIYEEPTDEELQEEE